MKVLKLIKELEKLDPDGDILFFDNNIEFYNISEKSIELGEGIYCTEIKKTYNIKIKKKENLSMI